MPARSKRSKSECSIEVRGELNTSEVNGIKDILALENRDYLKPPRNTNISLPPIGLDRSGNERAAFRTLLWNSLQEPRSSGIGWFLVVSHVAPLRFYSKHLLKHSPFRQTGVAFYSNKQSTDVQILLRGRLKVCQSSTLQGCAFQGL